jgi:hypothetical protein
MFALPPMDTASTLVFEDRTEIRGRIFESKAVIDAETDPKLALRTSRRSGLDAVTLAYFPRLVLTNAFGGAQPAAEPGVIVDDDAQKLDLLHQGNVLFEYQASPRTKFFSNNLVQYGQASISTLLVQPRWNGEDRPQLPRPFPTNPRVRFDLLSLNLQAAFFHMITPRWSIQPSVFYLTWGGPNFETRKRLNYLENPGISIESTYSATPTDDFVALLQPQLNSFTTTVIEEDATGAQLANDGKLLQDQATQTPSFVSRVGKPVFQVYGEARYRHKFTSLVLGEVAFGTNVTSQVRPDDPLDPFNFKDGTSSTQTRVLPVVEVLTNAGFKTRFARGRIVAFSRLGSWLNLLTGEIQPRTEHVGAASLIFGKTSVRAQLAFMVTLPGEKYGFRQITGELGMEQRFSKEWALDLGIRFGQQTAEVTNFARKTAAEPEIIERSSVQPGAFVGVTFQPRAVKF